MLGDIDHLDAALGPEVEEVKRLAIISLRRDFDFNDEEMSESLGVSLDIVQGVLLDYEAQKPSLI